jgi:KUP system potassium uptake protein
LAARPTAALSLAALGVVYGDIGTSPLYAMKECFAPSHGVAVTEENVLGVVSLFTWSLLLVVVGKYLTFVMRAENRGEGGILALLALLKDKTSRRGRILVTLAVFGAALLYGDGMITPPVSVLGAVEGLELVTDRLKGHVQYVAVGILVALFLIQRHGTRKIGAIFGPTMFVWFVTIGALGARSILRHPQILAALNPVHGVRFMANQGLRGYLLLGAVVLCITGAEALYADMGQFGKTPIRVAWYSLVFPALLLSYFGQGALYLSVGTGGHVDNPFFAQASGWARYPLIAIATLAAVIASQALISGAFSLTQQAVRLGFWPGVSIVHTSDEEAGQVYVPEINYMLGIGCVAITLAFQTADHLAAAYGIAVTGTMGITSVLFYVVARETWHWSRPVAGGIVACFLLVDLAFLGANVPKVAEGGWLPLVLAVGFFVVMTTWHKGRDIVLREVLSSAVPMKSFLVDIARDKPLRVPGIAVVLTPSLDVAPPVLLRFFAHSKVLHQHVVLLFVRVLDVATVPLAERITEVKDLGNGFLAIEAAFGFMQAPRIQDALAECGAYTALDPAGGVSFLLGRPSLTVGRSRQMRGWRRLLFSVLFRNARPLSALFQLPADRLVELRIDLPL